MKKTLMLGLTMTFIATGCSAPSNDMAKEEIKEEISQENEDGEASSAGNDKNIHRAVLDGIHNTAMIYHAMLQETFDFTDEDLAEFENVLDHHESTIRLAKEFDVSSEIQNSLEESLELTRQAIEQKDIYLLEEANEYLQNLDEQHWYEKK
jgi:hypothetical protein